MYLTKSKKTPVFALIFRIFGFLLGATSVILPFATKSMAGKGFMAKYTAVYFTMQTNVFSTLVFLALVIKTLVVFAKEKRLITAQINRSLHLACTLYITVTMAVYWIVLAPSFGVGDTPPAVCNALFLHLFMPLCAIVDCILFYEHGTLKKTDSLKWLSYPVLYLALVIVIAHVADTPYYEFVSNGKRIPLMYPYPFLDPQVTGKTGAALIMILLLALAECLGLLFIVLDNLIAKAAAKRRSVRSEAQCS